MLKVWKGSANVGAYKIEYIKYGVFTIGYQTKAYLTNDFHAEFNRVVCFSSGTSQIGFTHQTFENQKNSVKYSLSSS